MSSHTSSPKVKAINPKNMKTKSSKTKKTPTKVAKFTNKDVLDIITEFYASNNFATKEARINALLAEVNPLRKNKYMPTFKTEEEIGRIACAMTRSICEDIIALQAEGKRLIDYCDFAKTVPEEYIACAQAHKAVNFLKDVAGQHYNGMRAITMQKPDNVMNVFHGSFLWLIQETYVLERKDQLLSSALLNEWSDYHE